MQKIKGVAFDLEGTVIDVERFHFDSFIKAAHDCGIKLDFETIVERIPYAIGGGDELIARGIELWSGRYGSGLAERLLEKKQLYYDEMIKTAGGDIKPRPGFNTVLKEITASGLAIAIGSLTPTDQALTLLEHAGLLETFPRERTVFKDDVENTKPAPDVYHQTAKKMGIERSEQIVFEDSVAGLEAARAVGSLGIALPVHVTPQNLMKIIEAGAKRIFMDWREMNIISLLENLEREL